MSRNPYHIEGQEPTLRQSVFVFMDILGYSELIRQSEASGNQQQVLRTLHQALAAGRAWLEDKDQPSEMRTFIKKDRYALKAFTDNIVISWPVHDDAETEFGSAFFKLASFQFNMVTDGFFIRGALSVGDAYVDEVAVFGRALSEAHIGETTLARDPRIILTSSAVEVAKTHLNYYGNPRHAPHVREVLRDSDGQWFLNYLDCVLIAEDEHGPFYDEFLKHKMVVEDKLKEHIGNPPVWSKYAWVAGYHNYFCDLHSRHFTAEHKINVDLFRASPALIVD
ncbi:hypothetical protein [Methylobacter tundripaludum]|uniref:hypothetical protein n=1 Tax=Methylobacter tundripaludum TaxID=173365 RepID=UPI000A46BF2E|nr:hypothetical protein [Methylobacter tundripaludum]